MLIACCCARSRSRKVSWANSWVMARPVKLARAVRVLSAPSRSRTLERIRSEEHTSELQSLMRISYAVFCLKKKKENETNRELPHERPIIQHPKQQHTLTKLSDQQTPTHKPTSAQSQHNT